MSEDFAWRLNDDISFLQFSTAHRLNRPSALLSEVFKLRFKCSVL